MSGSCAGEFCSTRGPGEPGSQHGFAEQYFEAGRHVGAVMLEAMEATCLRVDLSPCVHASSLPLQDRALLLIAATIDFGMVANANDPFVAIDFEIANSRHDSACAVGFAACSGGAVVQSRSYLIRPPGRRFTFTRVHGLGWEDVREAPTFADLWPTLRGWLVAARFVAAHNAKFDRRVLNACCALYRLRPPRRRFVCTVELARDRWDVSSAGLAHVCRRLDIPLRHHDAGSDALACARIVLAAQAAGWRLR